LAGHAADEPFCLLTAGTLQPVVLPSWSIGATLSATARGGPLASIQFLGENIRPPAPVNLAAELQGGGDLVLSWTRRSRQGFVWLDGIDAPLGEANEQYRVSVAGASASIELPATQPSVTIDAAELATLGGALAIEVRQIGDAAISRPAQLTLPL
jgi:hypothetical protein